MYVKHVLCAYDVLINISINVLIIIVGTQLFYGACLVTEI